MLTVGASIIAIMKIPHAGYSYSIRYLDYGIRQNEIGSCVDLRIVLEWQASQGLEAQLRA